MTTATEIENPSAWGTLRHSAFRNVWASAVVSNVGSWMQDTAGTWLMTSLTTSPLLIALMQTAAGLPVLLLGYPAGATADIVDRRRLLIFWQVWMLATVAVLSVLTFAGIISPWTLLALTFLLNIGAAMNNPAWQAIVPELVPRSELPSAIAVNSAGYNLARALGPALGGLMVAAFATVTLGAGAVFMVNSLSFVAVIVVLYEWRSSPLFKSALPAERLSGALLSGLRYLRYTPELRATFVRTFTFAGFASAVWALLAVVARQDLRQGAMAYGILNGCLGAGAVVGASLLPRLRQRMSANMIVAGSSAIFAGTLATLGLVRNVPLIVVSLLAAGFAWTSALSTLNVTVQISTPPWVQARALGTYQMIFWGGVASGSAFWGFLAEHISTPAALLIAAASALASIPLVRRFHLLEETPPDLSPYRLNRAAPQVVIEPHPDDGPVLVTIEFEIREEDYADFTRAIHKVRDMRMRNGAIRWGVFQDTGQPDRFVETFVVDSWIDFLRQRERYSALDRALRDHAWGFHRGDLAPAVSYMLYAREALDK
ncbi:MAG TPA: MFS transporter [Terriglobia bacterium]|nr:MFS transporter [Terriglobia bacterium]